MMRASALISWALALSLSAGAAGAQNVPMGPGSVPGSGDSSRISNANRENNAEYNRLVGASDAKATVKTDGKAKQGHQAVPATAADIKAGSLLRDSAGIRIGTIDSVAADGAVVNTGQAKIKVPLVSFGKDDQGLLLPITAARFAELVAKAHGSN